MNLKIQRVVTGAAEENCWIIAAKSGEAVVIDPGDDATAILSAVKDLKVVQILLTHTHYDHVLGLSNLVDKTSAPVAVHTTEAGIIEQGQKNPPQPDINLPKVKVVTQLTGGETLPFAGGEIKVLTTPGHTVGSVCYLIGGHIFTGDTLFRENYGRTDLPTGNANAMRESLKKLCQLPSELIVHAGHGEDWTIGEAAKFNF